MRGANGGNRGGCIFDLGCTIFRVIVVRMDENGLPMALVIRHSLRVQMIFRFHQHQAPSQSRQNAETALLACLYFCFLALGFLLRQGSSLISRGICQAFAFNALQQFLCALSKRSPDVAQRNPGSYRRNICVSCANFQL